MLNIVIGAGLLSLPGLAYQQVGENAIWAWALCALVALPLLFVFIIMGSRFPDAGGVSSFAQMAFGKYVYIASSFIFLGAVFFWLARYCAHRWPLPVSSGPVRPVNSGNFLASDRDRNTTCITGSGLKDFGYGSFSNPVLASADYCRWVYPVSHLKCVKHAH